MYLYAGKPGSGTRPLWDMPDTLTKALGPDLDIDALRLLDFVTVRMSRLGGMMDLQLKQMMVHSFELTLVEWRCLAFLGALGTLTAAELCRLTDYDKAQITHTVRGLTKRKLISRQAGVAKAIPIDLTPTGRALFKRCVAARRRIEKSLLNRLSPQQRIALYESMTILAQTLVDELTEQQKEAAKRA